MLKARTPGVLHAAVQSSAATAATVLIVDDHAGFRRIAGTVMREGGYIVVGEAASGRSAIAAAQALRPRLVLLDIQLPDIDGFEVSAQLTAHGEGPDVVLVSSRSMGDYGHRVLTCGALGFIAKEELTLAAVEALLQRPR